MQATESARKREHTTRGGSETTLVFTPSSGIFVGVWCRFGRRAALGYAKPAPTRSPLQDFPHGAGDMGRSEGDCALC